MLGLAELMLTFFTVPKPFRGNIATIQRNAIRSWTLLRPACEVILFGDEDGTAEAAAGLGVRHDPNVARNDYGTPVLNDIFASAERLATHDALCYVNADIVLYGGLPSAVAAMASRRRRFLVIGKRTNLDSGEDLVGRPGWGADLWDRAAERGELQPAWSIDFFAFSKGLWSEFPPLAVGRVAFDNWLTFRARSQGAAVVDATGAVVAVHQNRDHGQIPATRDLWSPPEGRRSRELAGDPFNVFTIGDATHSLRDGRLHRALAGSLAPAVGRSGSLAPTLGIAVPAGAQDRRHHVPARSRLALALNSEVGRTQRLAWRDDK
jgi:hypothetical protein